jgi:hypothetical protein
LLGPERSRPDTRLALVTFLDTYARANRFKGAAGSIGPSLLSTMRICSMHGWTAPNAKPYSATVFAIAYAALLELWLLIG